MTLSAIGMLLLLVIGLYKVSARAGGSNTSLLQQPPATVAEKTAINTPQGSQGGGSRLGVPNLAGMSLEEATARVQAAGASYIVVSSGKDATAPQKVVKQLPAPGASLQNGDLVTLVVAP